VLVEKLQVQKVRHAQKKKFFSYPHPQVFSIDNADHLDEAWIKDKLAFFK